MSPTIPMLIGLYSILFGFFALSAFVLIRSYSRLGQMEHISRREKSALIKQLLAVLIQMATALPYALIRLSNASFLQAIFPFSMLLFSPLLYFAVSSIRNRVSLAGFREPFKGRAAIWNGVFTIIVILFATALILVSSSL